MEDAQNNEMSEVVTQEIEDHQEVQQQPDNQQPQEDANSRNWREINRAKKDLERELRAQREMNDKLMSMALANQAPQAKEVDEFDAIGDDEYIPKGKVAQMVEKKARKFAEEIAKKEVENYFEVQKKSQFMVNLKRQFSDFDQVVNDETLAILEQEEPELASLIAGTKDPYTMGVQSYKYIKALNLASKAPDVRREKEIDARLAKNAKTVQSPLVHDKRPIAQAYKMSEAEKSSLYAEMMGYAKGAGAVPEMRN